MTWNLPNILTVLRLAAAPGIALVFLGLPRPYADMAALILFIGAAVTDWIDGYLARAWQQESKFGAMLDPIADKAMVIIALLVICAAAGLAPVILIPAAFIAFRETFVSGLREFLGDTAGTLKVTRLAKWKTAAQMVAISVLFLAGALEVSFSMMVEGMDHATATAILQGDLPDHSGLSLRLQSWVIFWRLGVALIWLAMVLTVLTGVDYFRKALPFLRDD